MTRPKKYPDELIQRAVRIALQGERPDELMLPGPARGHSSVTQMTSGSPTSRLRARELRL
jgi:hypothetical protein